MNSCHEEGVRDRNGAGIEDADTALRAGSVASVPARFQIRIDSCLEEG
eukprot:gene27001-biopygen17571